MKTKPPRHRKSVAVVFVHGIFGSASETWLNGSNSFPELLADDPEFSLLIDPFVFEYSSPYLRSAGSVAEIAGQLEGSLEDHKVFEDHDKVVFLAHSMGGLIVRQFLLKKHDLQQVPMLFFYATPTNGSELAKVVRSLSSNPELRDLAVLEDNSLLQSVQDQWTGWPQARETPSYCAYELLPTYGLSIVSKSSARALCNRSPEAMTADHISIVKPKDREDTRYTRFTSAIRASVIPSLPKRAEITIKTTDNSKKTSTGASLTLMRKSTVLAQLQSIDGKFSRGEEEKFELQAPFSTSDIEKLVFQVEIRPLKTDSWTFEPSALFISTDGKAVPRSWPAVKLDDNHRSVKLLVQDVRNAVRREKKNAAR